MTQHIKVKVRISEGQNERLKKAFEDLDVKAVIAVTKSQCTNMRKAYEVNKSLTINMRQKRN